MKKLVGVVLAALVVLGVFTVGVSAVSVLDFTASAPVIAQGDEDDIDEKINVITWDVYNKLRDKVAYSLPMIALELSHVEKAYKSGQTYDALLDALTAMGVWLSDSVEYNTIYTFLDNNAALRAAYADGTLEDKLTELYNAAYDPYLAEFEKLVKDFFVTDALAFSEECLNFRKLEIASGKALRESNLTDKKLSEVKEKLNVIWERYVYDAALEKGDFEEAIKIIKNRINEWKKILAEYGIVLPGDPAPTPDPNPNPPTPTPEPSFIAKVWNFILKWFLFGWIWMKK